MNITLIYPEYPDTFWSFKTVLSYISKKAAFPPLGLMTVGAMLPKEWTLTLVDMNTRPLLDQHIQEADMVFISAML
ncbi:MAG: cobalamin B12-binding domain-containing protein, partial [Proteobacteria bacterium]|nr:cobalamin B12-binding domain-containing protein [Pseudomonadota bacterium]